MKHFLLFILVVTERRTPAATGRWSDMSPVELVTVAGSNGDLYKALQTLPGVQVQGETGRLLVRGAGTPRLCSAGSTWLRAVRRWSMSGCM